MHTTIMHTGEYCIKELKKLKEGIEKEIYRLPLYLIVIKNKVAHSFALKNLRQIKVLNSKTNNKCGKKEYAVIKLLDKKSEITIDFHGLYSLKVSRDANGKAIFLSFDFEN